MNNKKFLNVEESKLIIAGLGTEFALVQNPGYIFTPFEIYPLAPKRSTHMKRIDAIVMDMDGTTTTTETLCIHSLEYMVRKMSGLISKDDWKGFDKSDLPHIIGNSTTKHVEYLVKKYSHLFDNDETKLAFKLAHDWTLSNSLDAKRKEETIDTQSSLAASLTNRTSFSDALLVRIGIDIYYQRYHELLEKINRGKGKQVSEELFGDPEKSLIEPMPGILTFILLIKGLMTNEIISAVSEDDPQKEVLTELASIFTDHPVKTAIVTSSISYEANIVLSEVTKVLQKQIRELSISQKSKDELARVFSNFNNVYDAVVTASDSSEIRLKPHRDLYSIALHKLNISKNNFDNVIGFEDSESGTIAIRAAGIGKCVAVPFAETTGHNLDAAANICKGGIPEVIFNHKLFLNFR